jgi:hypothetical protein
VNDDAVESIDGGWPEAVTDDWGGGPAARREGGEGEMPAHRGRGIEKVVLTEVGRRRLQSRRHRHASGICLQTRSKKGEEGGGCSRLPNKEEGRRGKGAAAMSVTPFYSSTVEVGDGLVEMPRGERNGGGGPDSTWRATGGRVGVRLAANVRAWWRQRPIGEAGDRRTRDQRMRLVWAG